MIGPLAKAIKDAWDAHGTLPTLSPGGLTTETVQQDATFPYTQIQFALGAREYETGRGFQQRYNVTLKVRCKGDPASVTPLCATLNEFMETTAFDPSDESFVYCLQQPPGDLKNEGRSEQAEVIVLAISYEIMTSGPKN